MNAFATWLAKCGRTPDEIATDLGIAVSSVYNLRNGYFVAGRDLSVAIAELSAGAVPVDSWGKAKAKRRAPK